jgi:hypothetical protein
MSPMVGAASTVLAGSEDTDPGTTSGLPPEIKNGMGSVAGCPWLPGMGLEATYGSEKRQPARQ